MAQAPSIPLSVVSQHDFPCPKTGKPAGSYGYEVLEADGKLLYIEELTHVGIEATGTGASSMFSGEGRGDGMVIGWPTTWVAEVCDVSEVTRSFTANPGSEESGTTFSDPGAVQKP